MSHHKFIYSIGYLPVFYIFNNRVSNENSYLYCTVNTVDEILNYIYFCLVYQIFQLFTRNYFSFAALASGISFNDSSSDRQSNLLNVLIGPLFELFLTLLFYSGRLGFLNSVSDFFDCENLTELSL